MKSLYVTAGLGSCALVLVGCASAPVQYFTLMPVVADQASAVASGAATPRIEVLPVGLPEMLDRPQWVVRQGGAGVAVLDRVRWASPLSEELRAALSAALAGGRGTQAGAGAGQASPLWRAKLEVRRLDTWPGQQVQLDADWTVRRVAEGGTLLVCNSQIRQAAPAAATDYAGLAAAQQQAVQRLSQDIQQAVARGAC